jgi:hypothetical protein
MGSQYGVNKREFRSRSQEKYVRNVHGTGRKLVYRGKIKSYTVDRAKAEVNIVT